MNEIFDVCTLPAVSFAYSCFVAAFVSLRNSSEKENCQESKQNQKKKPAMNFCDRLFMCVCACDHHRTGILEMLF